MTRSLQFTSIIFLASTLIPISTVSAGRNADLERLYRGIRKVESGSYSRTRSYVKGDKGKSLGPYQIQEKYWRDARMPGSYRQVVNPDYAEKTMERYWSRYAASELRRGDYEALARCHNSGAGFRGKTQATNDYWRKVDKAMKR